MLVGVKCCVKGRRRLGPWQKEGGITGTTENLSTDTFLLRLLNPISIFTFYTTWLIQILDRESWNKHTSQNLFLLGKLFWFLSPPFFPLFSFKNNLSCLLPRIRQVILVGLGRAWVKRKNLILKKTLQSLFANREKKNHKNLTLICRVEDDQILMENLLLISYFKFIFILIWG